MLFTPNISRNLEIYSNYIIYEDNINRIQFGELFNLFIATPAHKRPLIVIIANKNGSNLLEKLRYTNNSIDFINSNKDYDRGIYVRRTAPDDLNDYVELYARGVYDSTVRAKLDKLLLKERQSPDAVLVLASKVIDLQARLMTEERLCVQSDIDQILEQLSFKSDVLGVERSEDRFRLKCYLLLQKTYCSENRESLDEALAIATTLGDEFGRALCMRFAHFLELAPQLEQHMLRAAEVIFRKHDSLELALYCANNLRVSAFSANNQIPEMFLDLCVEIDERLPALHRKHDIFYNYAIECILNDQRKVAEEILTGIGGSSARALVKCSAKLALLILAQLNDTKIEPSAIIELLVETMQTVDKSNKWHRSNLALNALTIAKNHDLNWKLLRDNFSDLLNLSDALDVKDTFSINKILANNLDLREYQNKTTIEGRFGRLYQKTKCLIPLYYIWS